MAETAFVPRWASPPGETIQQAMREQAIAPTSLSRELDLSPSDVERLLAGELPLTIGLSDRLTGIVGGSVEFWMTREAQYHASRRRVEADEWAQRVPLAQLAEFGWVETAPRDWLERINVCLGFFGVGDVPDWTKNYGSVVSEARFRSSQAHDRNDVAVAAWLRESDIELSKIRLNSWDKTAFAELLPELRPLTTMADPEQFLPRLQSACSEVGVAVGVVRAPRGCPVSGAARRLSNGHPSITLSGRYLADDHLWFTFFHEAAHLILHDDGAVYLDVIERDSATADTSDEAAADKLAGRTIVPTEFEARLRAARHKPFDLRRLSHELNVGLGVLVGQLQHRGWISHKSKLNRLKNRYRWNGTTLETA